MNSKWEIQTENGKFTTIKEYENYEHFESNVFMNDGYVFVNGKNGQPLLVRSTEIIYASQFGGLKC